MDNSFIDEVVSLFKEDYNGDDLHHWIDLDRLFVKSYENELMIRDLKYTKAKTLVIARIAFKHQRRGYGKRLLCIMEEFVRSNNYSSIVIEQAHTPEINSFAEKNGFELVCEINCTWEKEIS